MSKPDAADDPLIWLKVKQAAARAQVSIWTIYHEVAAGRLHAIRVGGKRSLRFRESWIDEWLESGATRVEVTPRRFGSR